MSLFQSIYSTTIKRKTKVNFFSLFFLSGLQSIVVDPHVKHVLILKYSSYEAKLPISLKECRIELVRYK